MNQDQTTKNQENHSPSKNQTTSGETSSQTTNKVEVTLDDLVKVSKDTRSQKTPEIENKKTSRSKRSKRKKTSRKSTNETGESVEDVPKPFEILDRELVKIIAGMIPFGLIASFTQQKKYELTDHEKTYLAIYWDAVIMKYLPTILDQYGEELTLISAIVILIIQKSGILQVTQNEIRESTV